MNEHWQKEILNLLLDKYERTAAFQKGELPDRRVLLRFYDAGKTDFPAYDIDDHIVRTAINETVIAMQSEKLVDFEWMRGEQNHIIKRVWLDFSNLDKAYQTVNRQSAKLLVTAVIRELEQEIEAVNTDWIVAFYSETKRLFGNEMSVRQPPFRRQSGTSRFVSDAAVHRQRIFYITDRAHLFGKVLRRFQSL